ncbi:MAG: ABC transporter ATP-binding protein [Desulfarculaceae bacterium]|nr:ABC transporter ATP-binding protein [Desulfarculaceae bacterium]
MIEVENLTKYYNDFCAVDHIDLQIHAGEITGILGPNGAGKTTMLRMLTGFFEPTIGRIKVKDLEMPGDSLKIKSMMGYLPESAPLYHNMIVYDYLAYVGRIKNLAEAQIPGRLKELSDICGLAEIMHKPVSDLSRGLRQRVGLSHALMTDPEILVLDEPTSGLDPNQIAEIREIIKTIGKQKTIVFSTHILSEAEATCDRVVIIGRGKIVADDTTSNLKTRMAKGADITLALAHADPKEVTDLLHRVDPSLTVRRKNQADPEAVSFQIKSLNDKDVMKDIYLAIKETDWVITEFKRDSDSLEHIFHELTKEV